MRVFRLINADGESKALDITTKNLFFYEPKGLGLERKLNFRQVGDRFVLVSNKSQQKTISGKVAFIGEDPYRAYWDFMRFIEKEPLWIRYWPDDYNHIERARSFVKRVVLKKIDKTELEHAGYLDCPIEFVSVTPWREHLTITNRVGAEAPLIWGKDGDHGAIEWGISWGPIDEWRRGMNSDSILNSPAKLTIFGPIVNPEWVHYVNGQIYSTGRLVSTINSGEKVVISNMGDPYTILKHNAETEAIIENLYDKSDFSTKRFIDIQKGNNRVVVTGSNSENPPAILEAYIYYESV